MAKPKKSRARTARPAWFDAWHALSPNARTASVLALLSVIGIGFMAPVIFSGKTLLGGDIVQWSAMAQSMMEAEDATGDKPLWATRPFGGMPGFMISYGNAIPQVDEVARIARQLFWPTSHLLILFLGTFLLVLQLTRDRLSSAFAAVAFGLTTYLPVLLVAGHNSKFVALAFAPWLLLAFVYALRSPGLLSGLLFSVALAVNIRAGHVQITYYALWVIGIWWVTEGVAAFRSGEGRRFLISTAWLGLGSVVAALMIAQPYLAQWEFKRYTIRGAAPGGAEGGLAWEYAMAWSQGKGELLTLLIADAYGGSSLYWGPKIFTGGPHYVGGIVVALALLGAILRPSRTSWALSIGVALMLLFALGENFEILNRPLFEHFPLFDAFRVPETWLSMVALVLAVLAAIGLRESVRTDREGGNNRTIIAAFGAVASLVFVLMVLGDAVMEFEKPGELQQLARQVAQQRPDVSLDDPQVQQLLGQEIARRKAERATVFAQDARRTLLFVILAGGLLLLVRRGRLPGWFAQAALVLLVAVDLGGVGHRYLNEDVLGPPGADEAPVPTYAFDDFVKQRVQAAGGEGRFRTLSLEGDPSALARPAYHYETLSGYHGAKLRRYQDFLESMLFNPDTGGLSPVALSMMNTRYVIARRPVPGMNAVFPDERTGFTVYENPDAMPRAWLVGEARLVESPEEQWALISGGLIDPARTALVDEDPGLAPAPIDSVATADVTLESYAAERMEWTVETDKDRLLTISEVYYPAGWTATIDGEPATIIPVNYLLRGVVVPEGRHTVALEFAPRSHRLGMLIAGGSTALVYATLLVLLGLAARRRISDAA